MTIIEKLHQDLPWLMQKIRKCRNYTSALVASSSMAASSALISEADEEGRYLVHTFECGPKEVDTEEFDLQLQTEEYRLYSWDGVRKFVEAFLEEASRERLCEVERRSQSHRDDLHAWRRY